MSARAQDLERVLRDAKRAYYADDAPVMGDAVYDSLERELRDIYAGKVPDGSVLNMVGWRDE